ncbi:hypothetical protein OROGR_013629 [Orobanche gracilis]
MLNSCKTLSEDAHKFMKLLEEGKLQLQLSRQRKYSRGEKLFHEDDWILCYDKSAEGQQSTGTGARWP